MNDDKLLEKIKRSADSCEVPEGLKPEMLDFVRPSEQGIRDRKIRRGIRGIAAAAAVVVLLLVFTQLPLTQKESSDSSNTASVRSRGLDTKDSESTDDTTEQTSEGKKVLDSMYVPAENYDDIYDAFQIQENYAENWAMDDVMEAGGAAAAGSSNSSTASTESAVADTAPAEADTGGNAEHSGTNVQVEGVDEGDVVKTDGEYLYIMRDSRDVRIVKADGADLEEVSVIRLPDKASEGSIQEIYLDGDVLNIICQQYDNSLTEKSADTYYMNYRAVTTLYTYDLKDRREPKLTGAVSQDGTYHTSRKVGQYVYLFTDYYPAYQLERQEAYAGDDPYGIMPLAAGETFAVSDIYLPAEGGGSQYLLITSVNIGKPDEIADKKAILDSASRFYVSTENIYLERDMWENTGDQTAIAKFSFRDGKIEGVGAAVIGGTVTDDFATNEYDGYLRVLTTRWSGNTQDNCIYVLNQDMEIVGKADGLAEGESIYSARFMGNTGYFVTYRQVDPLFSVDFTDPENPKILGELKVTGFSEYLHFYGENRLLGIGWETDPDTGTRKGLKLSMFDISDPSDVKEISRKIIENIDYFPGEYNYKALTVSPQKNVIGFVTTSYGNRGGSNSSYFVFSYDDHNGFKNAMTYSAQNDVSSEFENSRGVYIGDTFYIANSDAVLAFDMKNGYEKTGELRD